MIKAADNAAFIIYDHEIAATSGKNPGRVMGTENSRP